MSSDRIRTLIVDDEPLARAGLRLRLSRIDVVDVVGESADGYTAVEAIQDLRPDLVLLDVQMPGLDGFGVLSALSGFKLPAVVFVTAHDVYALRAFRVHAVDYLLKPVADNELVQAIERVEARLARANGTSQALSELVNEYQRTAAPETPRYIQRILVRQPTRVFFVPTSRVSRIETADNYLKIFTATDSHLIRGTMREIEQRLDPNQFVRIHRRTLVNLDCVEEIGVSAPGEYAVRLTDGTSHRVGRNYRDALLERGF